MASPVSTSLILASGSPRRAELLRSVGLSFEVIPPSISERERQFGESPAHYARALAEAKAKSVADAVENRSATVLGVDTVVVFEDQVLGKPRDESDAVAMLQRLCGHTHEVISAWFLLRLQDGETRSDHVDTAVQFVSADPAVLRAYAATGEPADKAGAYAIQGAGAFLVREIQGSVTNVIGLPLPEVLEHVHELTGMRPWGA